MIQGLKVHVGTYELRTLLRARRDKLRDMASGQTPKIVAHGYLARAAYLGWVADHLLDEEVYELSEDDLRRFELIEVPPP